MGLTLNTERYLELLQKHMPRPIESDEDYDYWAGILESIDFSPDSTAEERALAELMKSAMVDYDQKQNPELYESDPLGSLKFLMDANGMSQADLGRLLEVSRTTASQICGGTRGISKANALKLAERFGLPVGVFVV